MTPRHRRRLGVLVGIALLLPLLGASAAGGNPVDEKRAEASRLTQQLDAQGERISVLDEQYNQATLHAQQTEASLAKAKADLAAADQRNAGLRGQLADQVVNVYVHGGSTRLVAELTHSNGRDLSERQMYIRTATDQEQQALDQLRQARQDLAARRAELESAQRDARSATDRVAANRRAAAGVLASQQRTLAQVKGDLATLVAQQQAQAAADAARKAQAALAARQAARTTASVSHSSHGHSASAGPVGPAPPASSGAGAAVAEAQRQLGKPYQYGGAGPDSFDCSGLTMWAWRAGGVSLPHSAAAQYSSTTHVPLDALQPGDLLFYGSDIHHVGIYVGGGTMIEAPHTGANVRYASIWRSDLIGAGRP